MASLRWQWQHTKDIEKKDTEKDIDRKTISEEILMAVLNVHQYLSQNGKILRRTIKETSKALELHRCTVERIIRGENFKTLVKQSGVDSY